MTTKKTEADPPSGMTSRKTEAAPKTTGKQQLRLALGHPGEGLGEVGLHLLAGDDGVEEAVLEEELGALEALGELLADGLLDDAGASEDDQGAGFGDVEVAEHGEAGGDAAGGGMGHDGDIGDA